MTKILVVESRIRELAKGVSISADFFPELSRKVEFIFNEAKRRAEANGRKTLQAKDL